jgi:hypothetical protein
MSIGVLDKVGKADDAIFNVRLQKVDFLACSFLSQFDKLLLQGLIETIIHRKCRFFQQHTQKMTLTAAL